MPAENVTLGLPTEGNLVRIPLLISGNPWFTLTGATSTVASTITKTGTTAAISYAELRFLGLLVQVGASRMYGPVQFAITSALAQGGLQIAYGNQLGVVEPTAVTNYTKSNVAWGHGLIFVPGMRTKPKILRTQTITATLKAFYAAALTKTTPLIATVEAVCSTVDDPMAERVD